MPDYARAYQNRYPSLYEDEKAAARAAEIPGAAAATPDFDLLAAAGDPLIYVVTPDPELIIAPQLTKLGPVSHAVLADGGPVLAAGEVSLVG